MKKKLPFVMIITLTLASGCARISEETDVTELTTLKSTETTLSVTESTPAETESVLDTLTLEQKVGQLLLARCPEENAAETMAQYHLGGYTLYARDFENKTPDEVKSDIEKIQAAAEIPALIAVDEEGGKIVRVSKYKAYRDKPFSSQLELAKGGEALIVSETAEKALLLKSLGINLNLAPVADITDNPEDYIYDRTFGADAKTTGEFIARIVGVMNGENIGCCLKHFPGYGSNVDTHTGIAIDKRTAESFEQNDFIPFEYGIKAGAPAVMVNHNIICAYDDKLPASLSPEVHKVLREKLGFEGVIISDDLGMDAIELYSGEESPYVLAVEAGNDMLCTTEIEAAYNDVLSAVKSGRIKENRIDESIERILDMKNKAE